MQVQGHQLIGSAGRTTDDPRLQATDPATGQALAPAYPYGNGNDVAEACELAEAAYASYRHTSLEERATFLETIADAIEGLGDALTERAMQETGLPRARLEGERGRTCGQLRQFAGVVRRGEWLDVRIDPAQPERSPMPRARLLQQQIPLGPVAVFGASNFPLAFSVAGGDTASALAAGCPVVIKGHSAHPGTSELVGRAVQQAVVDCGLHEGVFSLLFGAGNEIGQALVEDPRIQAVGFTGSRNGGTALMRTAQQRPQPIPVYAEMSSINPVVLMPASLERQADDLGRAFVGSLTAGAGQFCTNPGLVLALKGEALDGFLASAAAALKQCETQTMLTAGIQQAYRQGVEQLAKHSDVEQLAAGIEESPSATPCQPHLFTTSATRFLADEALHDEVFGASALVVQCDDLDQLAEVIQGLEGQLTATLHADETDGDSARRLLPLLERRAGRILFNGWPTGVEVCDAMVHGGPWPATSDSRTTSVGTAAIHRFLRPVCYQDLPEYLAPEALQESNPLSLPRLVDGKREAR